MKSQSVALFLLRAICLITMITGLVSALGSHPNTQLPWAYLFETIEWPKTQAPTVFSHEARILSAVTGGVLFGWGLALLLIVNGPITRGEPEGRRIYLVSVLAWLVIDTSASYAASWPGNMVLNVVFFAAFLVPFYFVKFQR
jgi:hypothetical protein